MDLALFSLIAGYVVPIAGLALIAVGRVRNTLIASILVLLPLFYLAHYFGLQDLQGWPSAQSLPLQFEVLAERVIEPDTQGDTPGAVYLWVQAAGDQRPRAYRLPYSKALHEEAVRAGSRRAAGKVQTGIRMERAGQGNNSAGGRELPIRIMDRINPRPPPKPSIEAEKSRP